MGLNPLNHYEWNHFFIEEKMDESKKPKQISTTKV